jgi:hypothetical protein
MAANEIDPSVAAEAGGGETCVGGLVPVFRAD